LKTTGLQISQQESMAQIYPQVVLTRDDDDFKTLQNRLGNLKINDGSAVRTEPPINPISGKTGAAVLAAPLGDMKSSLNNDEKSLTIEDWVSMSEEILISKFGVYSAEAKLRISKHVSLKRKLAESHFTFSVASRSEQNDRFFFLLLDDNGFQTYHTEQLILDLIHARKYSDYDSQILGSKEGLKNTFQNNEAWYHNIHIHSSNPRYIIFLTDKHNGIEQATKQLLSEVINNTRLKPHLIRSPPDVWKPIQAGVGAGLGLLSLLPQAAPFTGLLQKGLDFVQSLHQYMKDRNFDLHVCKISDYNLNNYSPDIKCGSVVFNWCLTAIQPSVGLSQH